MPAPEGRALIRGKQFYEANLELLRFEDRDETLLLALPGLLFSCGGGVRPIQRRQIRTRQIDLPSSKQLQEPIIGQPQRTNSFPTAVALSPDGKYLALLNNGRGTAESQYDQSIAILELASNQLRDFPDPRLKVNARQTYFLGLAWSSDGKELYASIASLTDPEGNAVDARARSWRHRQWHRNLQIRKWRVDSRSLSQAAACATGERASNSPTAKSTSRRDLPFPILRAWRGENRR